jgi:malate dehydrogenase (oxaloacetate-decarboxylating)(NADP+)
MNDKAGSATAVPRGIDLLRNPELNKSTAFTEAERDFLGLRGLLPPHVSTQDEQVARVLGNFRRKTDDLEKFISLAALHDRNEALFFRLLMDHPDEMTPIVYTPTVGLACQKFGHIFQRPRGLYVSARDRGRVAEVLGNWPHANVSIVVVTDGERILGLGDLGANGMGIPVGKLALYTACAGVPPDECLPVVLDVGTNNEEFLKDPLYIGLHQKRLTGADYDALVEEFITAIGARFPRAMVQFEDFANHNAARLLEKYRNRIATFNDDIQGTAAVSLAGLFTAVRVTGTRMKDQKILFQGAGSAATGIAELAVLAMMADGLDEASARKRCWLFDSKGLVIASRTDLNAQKKPFAHDHAPAATLVDAVNAVKPTAIIGVAAVAGAFNEAVVRAMAAINPRPVIFALSNPTSKAECTAEQAYRWSGGKALFASGSPFDPVGLDGKLFVPRQGNNSYIFPGVGMGVIVSRASRITDEMFMASAKKLAELVTQADLDQGSLYPPLKDVRAVSAHIATAVAEIAWDRGLAKEPRPKDIAAFVKSRMYEPRYTDYAGG